MSATYEKVKWKIMWADRVSSEQPGVRTLRYKRSSLSCGSMSIRHGATRVADGGDDLKIWSVAANLLNKQVVADSRKGMILQPRANNSP
jgi:hypothetical protein